MTAIVQTKHSSYEATMSWIETIGTSNVGPSQSAHTLFHRLTSLHAAVSWSVHLANLSLSCDIPYIVRMARLLMVMRNLYLDAGFDSKLRSTINNCRTSLGSLGFQKLKPQEVTNLDNVVTSCYRVLEVVSEQMRICLR